MTHATIRGRPPRGLLSLSAGLVCAALLGGSLLAAFAGSGSYLLTLGGYLDIEGLVLLGIAWIGFLRKDGLHFAPPKGGAGAKPADSWEDRVPALGDPPPPPLALPGEEGPEGEEYRRLAAAEESLRSRILGADGGPSSPGGMPAKKGAGSLSFAVSGLLVLLLGLALEYLPPLLLS